MMLMKTALLLAIALVGCTADERPSAPVVKLEMVGEAPMRAEYMDGADAWTALGFDIGTDDSGLPECSRYWYRTGDADCQITITVARYPMLRERYGTDALSVIDARQIVIDSRDFDSFKLEQAMAHELGHILLDTGEHTAGGIMGGSTTYLTAVDRALACKTIGICI